MINWIFPCFVRRYSKRVAALNGICFEVAADKTRENSNDHNPEVSCTISFILCALEIFESLSSSVPYFFAWMPWFYESPLNAISDHQEQWWHVPIPFSPDVRLAHDAAFSMQFYNCQNIFSVYTAHKSSLHFHFHYVWVAGVVVVVERWMLLLRDSLRHSRWCCCSWCACVWFGC